ncbi:MAG TPA: DUF3800 domain-containing protein [Candidatus Sulfotelmatobacter sp.]|nr:DUF3800 domain-containing protein [Candidatus Sulfotelmatobacter sp.]
MWLSAGFFDESTDEDTEGTCYVIAGFIGAQLITAKVELRWRDLLDKYELEYFKASELSAGTGQFQKFRDNPSRYGFRSFSQREKDTFKEISTAFTDVIVNAESLYGIGAAVILPDLQRLQAEYPRAKRLPRPYHMCAQLVLVEAGNEMLAQNQPPRGDDTCFLRPIFDEHEEFSRRAKKAWDGFCQKNPNCSKFLLPPHYESENTYLTLQAADLLAFELRKLILMERRNLQTRRQPLKRMAQTGNIIRTFKVNYDALKMIADANIGSDPQEIVKRIAPNEVPFSALQDSAK